MKKRESFNSRWGFILACIGSAVGMGNIWMFPTRVSLYGGGSFLIPYFLFVALIGFTGVSGEMSFGRATRSGPVDAFGFACETKGKRKAGEALGLIPVLGSLAMAIGYTVVMGWIFRYMIGTFTGKTLSAVSVEDFAGAFESMASAFGNNFWQIVALVVAMVILAFGVGKGIEKVNKVLMPVFFLLFVALGILCCLSARCSGWIPLYFPCGTKSTCRSEDLDFCTWSGILFPVCSRKRNTDLWFLFVRWRKYSGRRRKSSIF